MIFRRPKLLNDTNSTSSELLREALLQYNVKIDPSDMGMNLIALKMDDIDFVEAIQLIEKTISVRIDKTGLDGSSTISDVVSLIEQARNLGSRAKV